jgi:ribosomal-protein-alanine N-acetyltransferase
MKRQFTHKGTAELVTERLILRQLTLADADAMYHNWASDPEVTKYLTWKTHKSPHYSQKALQKVWLEQYPKQDFYDWCIVLRETSEPIGTIGTVHIDEGVGSLEIGYCIGRKWWHCGYASEALTRIIDFFFVEVNASRIESKHNSKNVNSGKVMQKAGMQFEGTLRQSQKDNQGICDAVWYGILAEDYFENRES